MTSFVSPAKPSPNTVRCIGRISTDRDWRLPCSDTSIEKNRPAKEGTASKFAEQSATTHVDAAKILLVHISLHDENGVVQ